MKRIMKGAWQRRVVVVTVILAVLGVMVIRWLVRIDKIDRCLDAGGRWDYEQARCEEH